MIDGFTERADRVGALLEDPGTTFLIVTSPAARAGRGGDLLPPQARGRRACRSAGWSSTACTRRREPTASCRRRSPSELGADLARAGRRVGARARRARRARRGRRRAPARRRSATRRPSSCPSSTTTCTTSTGSCTCARTCSPRTSARLVEVSEAACRHGLGLLGQQLVGDAAQRRLEVPAEHVAQHRAQVRRRARRSASSTSGSGAHEPGDRGALERDRVARGGAPRRRGPRARAQIAAIRSATPA